VRTMNVAFDMETSDPDDVFTLCFLAGHPAVKLRAVTITPGSKQQIGLVKHVLKRLGLDIPIGARKPDHPKSCVSEFHHKWFGKIEEAVPDGLGWEILSSACMSSFPLAIVTGGPLGNLGDMIANGRIHELRGLIIQGGFAGDNVTKPEHRLPKFAGRETAPTFNLNGDVKSAWAVLAYPKVASRRLVSKNVCHGVIYDQPMHERMKPFRHVSAGIGMMIEGMEIYLKNKPEGKIFHDPLAACVAIEPEVCEFREVAIYRIKGEWGSKLESGTKTWISTAVNRELFEQVLSGQRGGGRTESLP